MEINHLAGGREGCTVLAVFEFRKGNSYWENFRVYWTPKECPNG